MSKHIAANGLNIILVTLVLVVGLMSWFQRTVETTGPLENVACVAVERGEGVSAVAERLEALGVIDHARLFRLYVNTREDPGQLTPGHFAVQPGTSIVDLHALLTEAEGSTCGTQLTVRIGVTRNDLLVRQLDPETGQFVDIQDLFPDEETRQQALNEALEDPSTQLRLTVVEGTTVAQVVNVIRQLPFLSGELLASTTEGRIAPDTYRLRSGQSRNEVLTMLTRRQDTLLARLWENRAPDLPLASPEEALILASIVERETGVARERAKVASVFHNRLREGMRLQADATVVYGVTNGQGPLQRPITRTDLDTDTPWNTYTRSGLPATPIANPGRAALEAVLNPDNTPFLFFVADGTGGHAFAVTYEEHRENVARWRDIEAQRRNSN